MERIDQAAITDLRRQILLALFARHALSLATFYAFAWGTAVLVLRMGRSTDRLDLAWGALGLAVVLVAALIIALRRVPAPASLRAAVDHHADAGGLVMAGDEYDLGDWAGQIQLRTRPTVRLDARRAMGMLLIAGAFVAGSFALPDDLAAMARPPAPLDVTEQVQDLNDKIQTLQQEKVIDDQQAHTLVEKLKDIVEQADGHDPSSTWQKLDHLEEQLSRAADEAAEQALREAQTLAELQAAASTAQTAMHDADAQADPDALAQQMKDLGELASKALAQSDALKELSGDQWAKAAADLAQLDEEALKALAQMGAAGMQQAAELAKAMKEIDANCMVKVDATGKVDVFDPDAKITLKDLKGTGPLTDTHAVRMTSEAVFKHDATVTLGMDLSAMGTGERIIALDDQLSSLAVYAKDPVNVITRDKLDHGGNEVVFTVNPTGQVDRYQLDPAASAACNACENAEQAFRMMGANAAAAQAQLQAMVQAMAAQGLIDPQQLAQQMQAAQQAQGKPGAGGVTRGRADAPMTWRDPSSDQGIEFKQQTLPPATLDALKDSQRLGISTGNHRLADGTQTPTSGALSGTAADGGSAARHTILPRHRAAVEQYFQDQSTPAPSPR